MSSPMLEDDLRSNVKGGLNRRIKAMVAANGGPEKCIGKPSATGLGVHIIFLSEQSPKPTTSPCPATRTPREEEDVDMVDSESGSDIDTAEQHAPHHEHDKPSSTLDAPRVPRRTGDRRPEDWNGGNLASIDGRVVNSMAHMTKCGQAPRSDLKDVEAARRRVEVQRHAEAKKIRIEQLMKRARREAQQLRQRAADLERETAEEVARLLREEMETDKEEGEEARSREMEEDGDKDRFDVQSNGSYTPTEIYSADDGDQPRWSSPFPSPSPMPLPTPYPRNERSPTPTPAQPPSPGPPQVAGPSGLRLGTQVQLARGPFRRQSTMPLALSPRTTTPPRADEFVVVTRQVADGLDDLTASHVRHKKWY
ncbi:hypothetical protein BJV78DRAFT_1195237 [Lactifluus subvellereus]|nr:hypothetical protein BJV78DRAFT_1195237 [Lactifluus subvellereus]